MAWTTALPCRTAAARWRLADSQHVVPDSGPDTFPCVGAAACLCVTLVGTMRDFSQLHADDGRRIVSAAAIFRTGSQGQQVLLTARRTEPEEFAGGWELPGGKIDEGETIEQALVREVAEELGIEIEVCDLVPGPDLHHGWPLGSYGVMIVHTARMVDAEDYPEPIEQHDAVAWVGHDNLDQVQWLPADRAPAVAAFAVWGDGE